MQPPLNVNRIKKRLFLITGTSNRFLTFSRKFLLNSNRFKNFVFDNQYQNIFVISDTAILKKVPFDVKFKLLSDYKIRHLNNKEILIKTFFRTFEKFLSNSLNKEIKNTNYRYFDLIKGQIINNIFNTILKKYLRLVSLFEFEKPDEIVILDSNSFYEKTALEIALSKDISVFNFNNTFISNFSYLFQCLQTSINFKISHFKIIKSNFNISRVRNSNNKKSILFFQNYFVTAPQFVPIIREINKSTDKESIVISDNLKDQKILDQNNIKYNLSENFISKIALSKAKTISDSFKRQIEFFFDNPHLRKILDSKKLYIENIIKEEFNNFFTARYFKSLIYNEALLSLKLSNKLDLIVVGNDSELYERSMIIFAKENKIPTIHMQHGFINKDGNWAWTESNKDSYYFNIFTDIFAVWGEKVKFSLVESGQNPKKIVVTGNPRFDELHSLKDNFEISTTVKKYNFQSNRIISFFVGPMVNKDYDLHWKEKFNEIMCFLKLLDKAVSKYPYFSVVVKPHPRDDIDFVIDRFSNKFSKKITVNNQIDTYELLCVSEIVVTKASTVGLEAMILDKPVICFDLNENFANDPLNYVSSGAALGVTSGKVLEDCLSDLINNKDLCQELSRKRKHFILDYAHKQDSFSSKRFVDLVSKLT